jgi:serine/threonine protein kinase
MIVKRFPYPNVDDVRLIHIINQGVLDYEAIENDEIRSLVIKMTSLNPSKRPTIIDVINEVEDLMAQIDKRQRSG